MSNSSLNIRFDKDVQTKSDFEQSNDEKNHNETQIWNDFRNGNESAFVSIYKLYFDTLVIYGSQFTRDKEIVKDAIQDLFIDLRNKRKNLPALNYSIKFYLFRSLKNNILKYNSKLVKVRKKNYEFAFNQLNLERSIESQIIQTQEQIAIKQRLNLAKNKLTNREREALFYLYHENLSYEEIRKLMQLNNVKSARNLVYCAIKSLKKHLKKK